MSYRIRTATEADAAALAAIYAPYVLHTAITFEYIPPDEAEFRNRIRAVKERYPYLVAEGAHGILGYAYASPFHPRAAYGWDAEGSIYLHPAAQHQGIGKALYQELERRLKAQNIISLCALIADTEEEDSYLTHNSVQFHAHCGFAMLGRYPKCGYKFGRWYDLVWMAKTLNPLPESPPPVLPPLHDEPEPSVSSGPPAP